MEHDEAERFRRTHPHRRAAGRTGGRAQGAVSLQPPPHRREPADAGKPARVRVCVRRSRAERLRRRDRHGADVRRERRYARGAPLYAGGARFFRRGDRPRAGRGRRDRQSHQDERLNLRRRMRLSGGDRLGLLHDCRGARRAFCNGSRPDRLCRRGRHGAPSGAYLRSHRRAGADPVHRAKRRGCHARHQRALAGEFPFGDEQNIV